MGDTTDKEKTYLKRVKADLDFYNEYKNLMEEIAKVYIDKGPDEAKAFIQSKTDHILAIAANEAFWALFTNL